MASNKKRSTKASSSLLKNHIYKGGTKKSSRISSIKSNAKDVKASKESLSKASRMVEIERYAKENNITITQAMIRFM